MKKTTLFVCALALAVCAGAAAAAGLDLTTVLSPDVAAFGLSAPSVHLASLAPPDLSTLGLAAAGAAGMAKITVRSPVQHDGVTYSEGRHDVDDDTAKAMIDSGTATEGWTEKTGALSEAGTQNPPGRSPARQSPGTPRREAGGDEQPDKTTTGSSKK